VPPARRGHRRECLERLQRPCSDNSSNAAEMQLYLLPRGGCARRVRTQNHPWPHSTATTGGRAGEPSAPSARVRARDGSPTVSGDSSLIAHGSRGQCMAPVAVVGPPRRPNGTAAELAADVHWRGPRAQGCRLAKRRLGDVNNIGILRISDDRQAAMLIAVRVTQMGWDMSQAQLLRRRAIKTFRFERVTW
jgi:hypothetical protein